MDPIPSDAAAADPLLERCLDALEDDPEADLTALLADDPARATEVREQLALLGRAGLLPSSDAPQRQPEQLGEFRILRPLGRGGMGIVYLAIQESLGREVALKLVHPEHLYFPLARDRFRREVRAAAQLRHPGIVPVHTCGEADGVPFYAMERIRGASLGELLEQLQDGPARDIDAPRFRRAFERALEVKGEAFRSDGLPQLRGTWVAECVAWARDVALALQHAHEREILHRDVKPSNLLLAIDGRLLIIDFGLARTDGDPRLTRTGTTLGSLPYQAPEQLRDPSRVDARTDVHALGATLYELLTLAPPFGDGSSGTRERILAGALDPPSRRNPQVPADVDAICLCALDPDPARRYPTAAAFADDLGRFLDHRPILARRPTAAQRLRRAIRRRPATAVAVVSLALLVFGAPTAFAIQQRRAAQDLGDALAVATAERERAAQHLEHALTAVDAMLSRTAASRLARIPRTAQLRRRLLEDALAFHLQLVEREPEDDRVRLATAAAHRRVGAIRTELGELTAALDDLARAAALLDAIDPAGPHAAAVRHERVVQLAAVARTRGRLGEHDAQFELQRAAVTGLEALLAAAPSNVELRADHARARIDLAVFHGRRGEVDAARTLIDTALADLDRWRAEPGSDRIATRVLNLRATALDGRAMVAVSSGDPFAAEADLLAAAETAEQVLAIDRDDPDATPRLAGARLRRALLLHDLQDFARAGDALDAAIGLLERLAQDEPDDPDWTGQLAVLLSTRADVHTRAGELDPARAAHQRGLGLLDELVGRQPEDPGLRARRAITRGQFAAFLGAIGDRAAQRAELDRTIAEQRELASGGDRRVAVNLAVSLATSAQLRGEAAADDPSADRATALDEITAAIALLRDAGSAATALHVDALRIQFDLALRFADPTAETALDEADQVCDAWLAARADDPQALTARTALGLERTRLLLGRDRFAEARDLLEGLLPVARAAAQGSAAGRREFATALLRLSDVCLRCDDVTAATSAFVAAVTEAGATRADFAEVPAFAALFDRADFAAAVAGATRERR